MLNSRRIMVPARDKRTILARRLKQDLGVQVQVSGMILIVTMTQTHGTLFQNLCMEVLGDQRKVFVFNDETHHQLEGFRNAIAILGIATEWDGNGNVSVTYNKFQERSVLGAHKRICPDVTIKQNTKRIGYTSLI